MLAAMAEGVSVMKKAVLVARILLGLVFFVFGLNGILHFLPMKMPTGDAGTMMGIMGAHGWLTFVSVLQIVGGLLLLVGRYVPLGLVILAPIIVNILLYHVLLDPAGIPPGLVTAVLEIFLIWAYRRSFRGLFDAAPEVA
jgi:putative oxidoreductase